MENNKKPDHGYVYIVRCSDDTLYTGIAKDIDNRINQHNKGRGARYTKTRLPVELVYSEKLPAYTDAMKREREIKKFTRARKLKLIEEQEENNTAKGPVNSKDRQKRQKKGKRKIHKIDNL